MESSAKAGGVVTNLLWGSENVAWVKRSRQLFQAAYEISRDRSIVQPYGMMTLFDDSVSEFVRQRADELNEDDTPAEIWSADRIVAEFPDLDRLAPTVQGLWTANDLHVNPTAYAQAVIDLARDAGLFIRLGERVMGVELTAHAVRVQLAQETLQAERVLVAAGTWTGKIVHKAGFQVPLRPYRVQLASLHMPDAYRLPMVWELATDVYLVPDGPHNLLAGDGTRLYEHDPDHYQTSGDDDFIADIAAHTMQLTSRAQNAGLRQAWAGLCGGTPDRLPLIGPVANRLFVACGDQGIGVMRGPALGELAADVVLGQAEVPHLNPLRYANTRDFPIRAGFTLES
jgi:glycine/D-amino acid oxidase-like deaminating enzyme